MATYVNTGTQNWTAVWDVVDATSYLDSEAASTNLTTSFVSSSTFTPGVITVSGIAVKIAAVLGSTGTMSVRLAIAGVAVPGTTVTVNVTDLAAANTTDANGGWALFQLATPVVLVSATIYSVQATTSNATQVALWRNATANNWSRFLQTTATGNPGSGDITHICGAMTGQGTQSPAIVTMNLTTAGTFGNVDVNQYGTLSYGTSASTTYQLGITGNLTVLSGGTFNDGTAGTPMPSSSFAGLSFNCTSNGQYGLQISSGATFNGYGASKTGATVLTADVSANATTFKVAASTGWNANDHLAIASTTRTATQSELVTMASVSSGTVTVATGGGSGGNSVQYAHGGTTVGPTTNQVAEVINITRNVTITGAGASVTSWLYIQPGAIVNLSNVEFYYIGTNVANQAGIDIYTGQNSESGTCSIQNCSIHDTYAEAVTIRTGTGGVIFENNVLWNTQTSKTASVQTMSIGATPTSPHTITGNTFVGCLCGSNYSVLLIADGGASTLTNNTIAGSGNGTSSLAFNWSTANGVIANTSGNVAHSNAGWGFQINAAIAGTISTSSAWRNTGRGFDISNWCPFLTIAGLTAFGNGTNNLQVDQAMPNLVLSNLVLDSDTVFSTTTNFSSVGGSMIVISNSTMGKNVNATNDIVITGNDTWSYITCFYVTLDSPTQVTFPTGSNGYVRVHALNQIIDNDYTFMPLGTISQNSLVIHSTTGYSWQMAPNLSTTISVSQPYPLIMPGPTAFDTMKSPVNANTQVTVSCWVVYDFGYQGGYFSQPQLVLKGGVLQGIANDVVATGTETYGSKTTITAATNASPIQITTAANHGYSTGDRVYIEGITGNTNANGSWTITKVSNTAFTLNGSSGNGTFGGTNPTVDRWVQLTVQATPTETGVVEFYVACANDAGQVFVDDFSVTQP